MTVREALARRMTAEHLLAAQEEALSQRSRPQSPSDPSTERPGRPTTRPSWQHWQPRPARTSIMAGTPPARAWTSNRFPGNGSRTSSPDVSCYGHGPTTSCTLQRKMSYGNYAYSCRVKHSSRTTRVTRPGFAADASPTFAEVTAHLAKSFIKPYQGAVRFKRITGSSGKEAKQQLHNARQGCLDDGIPVDDLSPAEYLYYIYQLSLLPAHNAQFLATLSNNPLASDNYLRILTPMGEADRWASVA